MRTLHTGKIQQGLVQATKSGGISAALMAYMQSSEQVTAMAAVGALATGECGGYIVQLLPEVPEGPLMLMTERLKDFPTIETLLGGEDGTPDRLIAEILYGMPFAEVGRRDLRFECRCNEERLLATLLSLPRTDIRELVNGMTRGEALEIDCDYCGHHYRISPERLRGVLVEN